MYTKHFTIIFVCICAIHTAASSESSARCRRQTGGAGTCILTPQATEGPYYWNATIRQNITDGKPGIPFRLQIQVIDTNNCSALANVLVDLWHCDAIGIYSHYIAASQGNSAGGNDNQTFFRGLALTNSNGIAVFDTIYPGWYSGRATHMHVKVHVGSTIISNVSGTYSGGHVSHTGQFFFNDSLTDYVATISPYSNHTITRTLNSEDTIYASANGSVTLITVSQNSLTNYTGAIVLGVNSSATPDAVDAGGSGGGGSGPGGNTPGTGGTPPGGVSSTTIISTTTVDISISSFATNFNTVNLINCVLFNIIFTLALYVF